MHKFAKPKYIPPHLTTGSEEACEVVKVFRAITPDAYTISVPRRKANAGVADHLFFLHNRRVLLAWDSKAGYEFAPPADPRRLEPEQKVFGELMARGYRTMFGWGDRDTARQWLIDAVGGDRSELDRARMVHTARAIITAAIQLEHAATHGHVTEVRDLVRDCRKATEAAHDAAWPPLPGAQP